MAWASYVLQITVKLSVKTVVKFHPIEVKLLLGFCVATNYAKNLPVQNARNFSLPIHLIFIRIEEFFKAFFVLQEILK